MPGSSLLVALGPGCAPVGPHSKGTMLDLEDSEPLGLAVKSTSLKRQHDGRTHHVSTALHTARRAQKDKASGTTLIVRAAMSCPLGTA